MPMNGDILIVEDSLTQAERLKHTLQEAYPDTRIRLAMNGQEGIEAVRERPPKLVISDVIMPLMDGYEMCANIKKDEKYKNIPVILLTSLSDPEDIIRGLNAGTDYYLTKPYEEDFLLFKVKSILEHPTGPESDGNLGWKVNFAGREHIVHTDLQQMLNLLLSTYENAVQKNRKLLIVQEQLRWANETLEERVRERTRELSQANEQLRIEVAERQRAEDGLSQQLKRLDALRQIDAAITSSLDLRLTLNVVLDQVTSQLGVDAADILLLKPASLRLEPAAKRGFRGRPQSIDTYEYAKGLSGRVTRERKAVRIEKFADHHELPMPEEMLRKEGFVSYAAVPLTAKAKVQGVLEVYHRGPMNTDPDWFGFLETLAGQAAIAIDNAVLFENLEQSNIELLDAYENTLEGWSKALDLRDKETEGHSMRVTHMTVLLARELGFSGSELTHVRRGALLHDIGKLGVPDSILRKPGPLADEEWQVMRQHTNYAYEWLSPISFLRPALDIPYCHHEKWDGTGYPQGLAGERIPVSARIFALADVWDALRSERPYRKAWSRRRCIEHIKNLSGSHFDPQIVVVFQKLYEVLGSEFDLLPDVADEPGT